MAGQAWERARARKGERREREPTPGDITNDVSDFRARPPERAALSARTALRRHVNEPLGADSTATQTRVIGCAFPKDRAAGCGSELLAGKWLVGLSPGYWKVMVGRRRGPGARGFPRGRHRLGLAARLQAVRGRTAALCSPGTTSAGPHFLRFPTLLPVSQVRVSEINSLPLKCCITTTRGSRDDDDKIDGNSVALGPGRRLFPVGVLSLPLAVSSTQKESPAALKNQARCFSLQ